MELLLSSTLLLALPFFACSHHQHVSKREAVSSFCFYLLQHCFSLGLARMERPRRL